MYFSVWFFLTDKRHKSTKIQGLQGVHAESILSFSSSTPHSKGEVSLAQILCM